MRYLVVKNTDTDEEYNLFDFIDEAPVKSKIPYALEMREKKDDINYAKQVNVKEEEDFQLYEQNILISVEVIRELFYCDYDLDVLFKLEKDKDYYFQTFKEDETTDEYMKDQKKTKTSYHCWLYYWIVDENGNPIDNEYKIRKREYSGRSFFALWYVNNCNDENSEDTQSEISLTDDENENESSELHPELSVESV